jgi:hypothetical protein
VRAARHASRARLVLLQGGRADAPDAIGREDAAWRALSERIGWNEDVPTLPHDYEARLAERIFGADSLLDGSLLDGPRSQADVARGEVARGERFDDSLPVAAGEPAWDDVGAAPVLREPVLLERRWLAGSLFVVAAAAAALVWIVGREPSAPRPRPLEAVPASPVVPAPPPEDPEVRDPGASRFASAETVEGVEHVESPRRRGSERTLAAKVPTRGRARGASRAIHSETSAGSAGDGPNHAASGRPAAPSDASLALALHEHGPSAVDLGDGAPLAPSPSSRDELEPWVGLGATQVHPRETHVGWSLAPNRDRWIGVSAASAGEAPVASGVGVVAQIDLASAIRF